MNSFRENPDGEENQRATKENDLEVKRLQFLANTIECPRCGYPTNKEIIKDFKMCFDCHEEIEGL